MKKIFFLCVIFLWTLPVLSAEYIDSFDAEILINPNASLNVTETITVIPEQKGIKHGIYRDLPISKGEVYEIVTILKDGLPVPYTRTYDKYMTRLRIGSSQEILPIGKPVTYTIYYTAYYTGLARFDTYDEIYWNVTGIWQFPINKTTARILLPNGAEMLQKASYRGYIGSNNSAVYEGNNTFSTDLLKSGEQLTVSIGFTPGLIEAPIGENPRPDYGLIAGITAPIQYFFKRNFNTDLSRETDVSNAVILLVGLLLYMLLCWVWRGRDKYYKTPMVEYDISESVSPAQCALWAQYGLVSDTELMAIHLVEMAQKGFIQIDKEEYPGKPYPVYFIVKTNKQAHTSDELKLNQSFPNTVVLDGEYDGKFARYVQSFFTKQSQQYKKECMHNGIWIFWGLVFFVVLMYCTPRPVALTNGAVIPFLILTGLSLVGSRFQAFITATAFITGIICYLLGGTNIAFNEIIWQMIVGTLSAVVLFPLFSKLMKQPTKSGATKLAKVKGLELFLKTLDIKTPVAYTKEKAEELYPYALALGLSDEWQSRFRSLVGSAMIATAVYHGSFHSGLSSGICSAAQSPNSGNGSGGSSGGGSCGGGSSGGGGGGGGGGGW